MERLSCHSKENDTLTLPVMVLSAAVLQISRPRCRYRSIKLEMSAEMHQLLHLVHLSFYC